jgi:hypothetical protein
VLKFPHAYLSGSQVISIEIFVRILIFKNDGLYDVMIATDAPNMVPMEEEPAEAEEETKKSRIDFIWEIICKRLGTFFF